MNREKKRAQIVQERTGLPYSHALQMLREEVMRRDAEQVRKNRPDIDLQELMGVVARGRDVDTHIVKHALEARIGNVLASALHEALDGDHKYALPKKA